MTEGLFDSHFLPNSFSLPGTLALIEILEEDWFKKIDKNKIIFIFDNDWGNWINYSWSLYLSKKGYKIALLPMIFFGKDLNDLVVMGLSKRFIKILIDFLSLIPKPVVIFYLKVRWNLYLRLNKLFPRKS